MNGVNVTYSSHFYVDFVLYIAIRHL